MAAVDERAVTSARDDTDIAADACAYLLISFFEVNAFGRRTFDVWDTAL